ncbi:pancreatic lipase-related protein 2-like [Pieris napi]|uniref:pancreatic lipase-related protein 2-like n=1 Tax=Pieris napi TaxID=78633 RepID=UPI001FB9A7E9|nr:pancreatic lipase-related protein 2-like [Pieris napi]
MELFILLSLFVSLCAGGPKPSSDYIPIIPGDNSHYVEGVSRYVWIPDGDDVPHLVDLHAATENFDSKSGAQNEYWLYTRRNPQNHQRLRHNDANSVRNSNYNPNLPTAFIAHGWNSDGNSKVNTNVRDALLHIGEYNVIALDWRRGANGLYSSSVRAIPDTGEHLAFFISWLISSFGGNLNNVHLIGYSLGAHVVGNAGRTLGRRVARISGLDPAGPQFGRNPQALNSQDATYVECIHTDGGTMGIFDPICQTNFYPNGGINPQPGCWINTCSHSRSYQLYAATVRYDRFIGRQCANLDEARRNRCGGSQMRMGNANLNKRGFGLYGLSTGGEWPY